MKSPIILAVLACTAFALGCSSNTDYGVVEAWGKAMIEKDLEKAASYWEPADGRTIAKLSAYRDNGLNKVVVLPTTPIGDKSTVYALLTFRDETVRFGCFTRKAEGRWKITFCGRVLN